MAFSVTEIPLDLGEDPGPSVFELDHGHGAVSRPSFRVEVLDRGAGLGEVSGGTTFAFQGAGRSSASGISVTEKGHRTA